MPDTLGQYLPPSKSLLIRQLAIDFLVTREQGRRWSTPPPLSELPADVQAMQGALAQLDSGRTLIEVGAAGTVWRIIIALAALSAQQPLCIQGEPYLMSRPIRPLLEVLRSMGAECESLPGGTIAITPSPKGLSGGELSTDLLTQSSQFATALMLIAPYLTTTLSLSLNSPLAQYPYLSMTLALMEKAGAQVRTTTNKIEITPQPYSPQYAIAKTTTEADWSAASYLWSFYALSKCDTPLQIVAHLPQGIQGDAALIDYMLHLGVNSTPLEHGQWLLTKKTIPQGVWEADLYTTPDLVPTFVVAALGLGIPFSFRGVQRLHFKECDRLAVLQEGALALGWRLRVEKDLLTWDGSPAAPPSGTPTLLCHEDHRIAMAWAPLALREHRFALEDPTVVDKSFPLFWHEAKAAGLELKSLL